MDEIDRYDPEVESDYYGSHAFMEGSSIGDYVKYEDHKRIVDELKKESARLQSVICKECKW